MSIAMVVGVLALVVGCLFVYGIMRMNNRDG